jgi:hypothetical protein
MLSHVIDYYKILENYYSYHSCIQKKIITYYEYDYMVADGTTVFVDVGSSIATGYVSRED